MYRLAQTIPGDGPACLIPEIAFHPDGTQFAASYMGNDEVRLYDATTRTVRRVYRNPESGLDQPHAVLLTRNHLIVASRHLRDRPATYTVYRLDSDSGAPVFTLQAPFEHLREAHSMAMHGDTLVVTHCENEGAVGALLSYRFDDSSGEISGPLDRHERVFDDLGMAKGVTFTPDGRQVLVSFNADKQLNGTERLMFRLFKMWNIFAVSGLRGLVDKLRSRDEPRRRLKSALHNGVAVFDVDSAGRFSPEPRRVLRRRNFCRLENIVINDNLVALTDTVNHRVLLFDYAADPDLESPLQSIADNLTLPHAVKFSPDRQLLVISNYGLRSRQQVIHWRYFTNPRSDNLVVLERSAA